MSEYDHRCCYTRQALQRLLRNPTPRRLRSRIVALSRLLAEIEHFVGWPALQQSLRTDIAVLQRQMEAQ